MTRAVPAATLLCMTALVLALYIAAAELEVLAGILHYRHATWDDDGTGLYAVPEPPLRPALVAIAGVVVAVAGNIVALVG